MDINETNWCRLCKTTDVIGDYGLCFSCIDKIKTDGALSRLCANGALSLANATDDDLYNEMMKRDLKGVLARRLDDDTLIQEVKVRDIQVLYGSRTTRLIHELRRQAEGVGIDEYYRDEKREGEPHGSDKVGAKITAVQVLQRRRKKRVKVVEFDKRSITDYRTTNQITIEIEKDSTQDELDEAFIG